MTVGARQAAAICEIVDDGTTPSPPPQPPAANTRRSVMKRRPQAHRRRPPGNRRRIAGSKQSSDDARGGRDWTSRGVARRSARSAARRGAAPAAQDVRENKWRPPGRHVPCRWRHVGRCAVFYNCCRLTGPAELLRAGHAQRPPARVHTYRH